MRNNMDEMPTKNILKAENLIKRVPSPEGILTILDDISLELQPAESLGILGVSGSGKSTLLGVLAGLDLPSSGRVFLNGADLTTLDEDGRAQLRGRHIGFVFQSFQLLASLTALENVMLPLELAGRSDARETALNAIAQVGLKARAGHYPHQLSGGEQQRVAIARAFGLKPRLLFADEPTGNLDRRTGTAVCDLLFDLNADHATSLVLVTHDESLAQRCDRTLSLDAGRLIGETGVTPITRQARA
jgi:putative ABC transport system ATP-binding protein